MNRLFVIADEWISNYTVPLLINHKKENSFTWNKTVRQLGSTTGLFLRGRSLKMVSLK